MSFFLFSVDISCFFYLDNTSISNHATNHLGTALVFDSNVDAKYSLILNPNVGTTHVADICIGAWTQSGRTAEEAGGV
jgi:hypothetical protein